MDYKRYRNPTIKEIDGRKRCIDIWVQYVAYLNTTFRSIANQHQITYERVRQIYKKVWKWVNHPGYKKYYDLTRVSDKTLKPLSTHDIKEKAIKLDQKISEKIYNVFLDDCCGKLDPPVFLSCGPIDHRKEVVNATSHTR